MKVKLTYEFDLPQEYSDMKRVIHGEDTIFAVWEFQEQILRPLIKWGHEFDSADEALEHVREELQRCLSEDGVDIYELVGS